MTDDAVWVGIDLGTQSVRVVAVDDAGARIASCSRPLHSRRDGARHEQDPAEWWSATCDALREATATVGARTVRAVAVSATSGTVVVVDDHGRPISGGVMYDDARGAALTDGVNAAGAEVWSRLGYRMQGSWALPTVLALQQDGTLRSGRSIVHQPDVVTARLAGHRVPSDSSHALKTGLDLDAMAWPGDVMSALGLDLDALPPVVTSGTVIGWVGAGASSETGLPTGCAIVAGMTDGCAAQIAAGALEPGSWNSVLGTTLVVKGVGTERRTDPTGAVYAHRAPFGSGWFPGGASSTGAGAVAHWLPGRDLDAVTPEAARTHPPVSYPLVGTGERFPFVAPSATAFFGEREEPPGDDASRLAAIAHGVAHVERLGYDLLEFAGYEVRGAISLTGGGARNAWWNRVRCDSLGRSVRVPASGEGAVGMAVLAAAAVGGDPGDAGRLGAAAARLLGPADVLDPEPAPLDRYRGFLDMLRRRGWLDVDLHDFAQERAA